MESVLCLLSYLLLVWDSMHIRPDAEDLFSCVSWAHRLCSARTDQTARQRVFRRELGPEIFQSMKFGLPNQTLERTGLGLRVLPWSFGFAHVRTPVAQLYR